MHDFFQFAEPILTTNQDDVINAPGPLENSNRLCDNCFSVEHREKLVKAHAAAMAGCDDNGGEHGRSYIVTSIQRSNVATI
jgi:hypothetical protein